ncbi:MAG: PEP-CTERM sorting domain-containing protein [Sulfuricella sp.]
MFTRKLMLAAFGVFFTVGQAQASLFTFTATGDPNVSGFVQFDDLGFDGSNFQLVPNSFITALALSVFGQTYTLADVATGASTVIDSSGLLPSIVNGAGNLADNGLQAIAFFPDGFDGTALDGDASLAIGPSGDLAGDSFYAVQWVASTTSVPEPGTLALLGLGLSGLALSSYRRKAAQA